MGQSRDSALMISHVILDEIHERDKFADFLLIELRRMIKRNFDFKSLPVSFPVLLPVQLKIEKKVKL